jgi:tripartite ATP-independent transporter DctM subunit
VTDLVIDGAKTTESSPRVSTASPPAEAKASVAFVPHPITRPLLVVSDWLAAVMLAADVLVVIGSVVARTTFDAPVEWADDVARGLMVGSTFFGAASATARHESLGIDFFAARLPPRLRELVDAVTWLLILGLSAYVAFFTIDLSLMTTGQTTGSGLPLEWTFYPMGGGMICMTAFAAETMVRLPVRRIVESVAVLAVIIGAYMAWVTVLPGAVPSPGPLMLIGLVVTLFGGLPVGFVLVLAALIFVLTEGSLPGVIVSQQMARGIDSFVMLAVPFFVLVGYLMEANGMSIRLIEALRRMVGGMRGGLNMVLVLSMVLFSGISGSKTADVAAVGSVLIPAAKRAKQNPGSAVALLGASAVMAESIPPCINLIILAFVSNISIGGIFMAGFIPAGMMATCLIIASIAFGTRAAIVGDGESFVGKRGVWAGTIVSIGLIVMIFVGFKFGYATATEISAFAAAYAVVFGALVFRELTWRSLYQCLVQSACRSGMVLFICSCAQSLSFTLTIQQIPHALGLFMIHLSQTAGVGTFLLVSIAILIVMGSVLEGAAALILFGPLLVPIAAQMGIDPLQMGIVLVISMGIGYFAPPIGCGLLTCCLVGDVPLEQAIKPIFGYLGLLLACVIVIAFFPAISTTLPHAFGY